jgi:hypothetical protein
MLSLPQSNAANNVVTISENSTTMKILLSFIYPKPYEPNFTLEEITNLLIVSEKYEFDFVRRQIMDSLLKRLLQTPCEALYIYSIGARFGMNELVQEASITFLKCSPGMFSLEPLGKPEGLKVHLSGMTAWDYHRLFRFYLFRLKKAQEFIRASKFPGPIQFCSRTYSAFSSQDVWAQFKEKAIAELEKSGPTSDHIFENDFVLSCGEGLCLHCCQFFVVGTRNALKDLKKKIDGLPLDMDSGT